eukprot:1155519-Pelagomonas_calceolata.AAC.1
MRAWLGIVSHAPEGVGSPLPALQCLAPSGAPTKRTLQAQLNQRSDGVVIIDSACHTQYHLRVEMRGFPLDRARKYGIRTALVPGKGASTIGKSPVWDVFSDVFRDFNALLLELFLEQASMATRNEPCAPCLILVTRVENSLLKSASGASKLISILDRMSNKLQSKLGGSVRVKTKLFKGLQSLGGVDDPAHT